MIESLGTSLYVSAGLFWKAFWALAFGYVPSSLIQVLVPREGIAEHLARSGFKETVLAMVLGPASSSRSFATLSAGRAPLVKDAAHTDECNQPVAAVAALACIVLVGSSRWPSSLVRRDNQGETRSHPDCRSDEAELFEVEHHLMDGGRRDTEVALHVGLGGRSALQALVGVDEGQILALLVGESGRHGLSTGL